MTIGWSKARTANKFLPFGWRCPKGNDFVKPRGRSRSRVSWKVASNNKGKNDSLISMDSSMVVNPLSSKNQDEITDLVVPVASKDRINVSNNIILNLNSSSDTTLVDSLPIEADLVTFELVTSIFSVPSESISDSTIFNNQNKFSILQVTDENVVSINNKDTSQISASFLDNMSKVLISTDLNNHNSSKQSIAMGKMPRNKMARKANSSSSKQ
ncbi:hypothetical protein MA16_Dca016009 [Dendrobium catenatum]|uniref:Uncharacterized protein n=1 Tax=Dendrobium catenatum TaxID=906689 RepID=A0A2I0VV48_9ASPA|nr:hypothetical protein MA16_Dca016009 [Dendrobium catenatum]